MIIPENIKLLFEDYCEGCDLCKIVTEDYEETNSDGYQEDKTVVSCEHYFACERAFCLMEDGEQE